MSHTPKAIRKQKKALMLAQRPALLMLRRHVWPAITAARAERRTVKPSGPYAWKMTHYAVLVPPSVPCHG